MSFSKKSGCHWELFFFHEFNFLPWTHAGRGRRARGSERKFQDLRKVNTMKFHKQISRSFTKFQISPKNSSTILPYVILTLNCKMLKQPFETSREVSWNFAIIFTWNYVKNQQKFHLQFPFASEGAGACMFFFFRKRSVFSNPGTCTATSKRVQQPRGVCSKVRAVRSIGMKII